MAPPDPPENPKRQLVCAGRYEVRLDDPLPDFDCPGAKAFAVASLRGSSGLYALVPHKNQLPRAELYGSALNVNTPFATRFADHDLIYFPETGQIHPVLLQEKPLGPRLMQTPDEERAPINMDLPFKQLVESLTTALRDMHLAGVCHGNINPANLYQRDTGHYVQLGEYLSASAGINQWPACETIERLMAEPIGRGPPMPADDIYAAGVTLLILMLGRLPIHHLSPGELLIAKIEKGSMMALLGGAKLPSAFSEIFRGLLADDPRARWGVDDLEHWLGGRRLGNKTTSSVKKAQRAAEFDGQNFMNLRSLTHAMTRNVEAGARFIEDSSLDRWLRRSLMDEDLADAVAETVSASSSFSKGGTPQERLVARVALTLDPQAPLRFRDVAAFPAGIGPKLAQQLLSGQTPRTVPDLMLSQLITHWGQQQLLLGNTDFSATQQVIEGARMLLERGMPGFGLERVVYEINPYLPCLSSMAEGCYALTPKALLEAMEREASRHPDENEREPMDRHIAAFLLARLRKMNDRFFPLLAPGTDTGQRAIAILSILAETQRKSSVEGLPYLAGWLTNLITPAMSRFHHRALREKVLRDVKRAASKGRLDEMLGIIDDGATITKDEDGFKAACNEYQHWERMAKSLSTDHGVRERQLTHQGRQMTSFIAVFIALASAFLTVFWLVI